MIRHATDSDADALATLHRRCFAPRGERVWPAAEWAALFTNRATHCLVVDEDRLVGALLMQIGGDCADIITIMTDPAKQQSGIGRALLDAGMAHLPPLGVSRLMLEVAADNLAARALYTRAGFLPIGTRPHYYKRSGTDRVDALLLACDL
ncbi:MAG: GNAT family N-acetyltransferase [Alphaproteobacteria bacterium]